MEKKKSEIDLTAAERRERLLRVSIQSADQLKAWLEKSGRRWLIFDALGLVDSLPFPEGVDTLIQIIACYRDHRSVQPSGRTETITDPTLGKKIQAPIFKGELLEIEELDRAIRYLIRQASDKDPNWSLNNAPL